MSGRALHAEQRVFRQPEGHCTQNNRVSDLRKGIVHRTIRIQASGRALYTEQWPSKRPDRHCTQNNGGIGRPDGHCLQNNGHSEVPGGMIHKPKRGNLFGIDRLSNPPYIRGPHTRGANTHKRETIMAPPDWAKRHLIYGSAGMAASGMMNSQGNSDPDEDESPALDITPRAASGNLRAVIIGNSEGAGEAENPLDRIFENVAGVEVVAISDPNDDGREAAKEKCGAQEAYANFEEMLAKEKPDLVSISAQSPDLHYAMAKAALAAEAHLFVEMPFTLTLTEADEILAIADQRGLKIVVANSMRLDSDLRKFLDRRHRFIGELLELRVYGQMDDAAGGVDLLVHGTPLFDLVRLLAGEVESCSAQIRKDGRDATISDVEEAASGRLGPVLGDEIFARFSMDSGVNVIFQSRKKLRDITGPCGIELIGAKSKARIFAGNPVTFSVLRTPDSHLTDREDVWTHWPDDNPDEEGEEKLSVVDEANRKLAKDWLKAIAKEKEPLCSGYRAMKALEMAHGIWESGLTGRKIQFPLADREHPLDAHQSSD